jgi:hypothetical protein
MINNLVKDIYHVVSRGNYSEGYSTKLGHDVGKRLDHWAKPETTRSGLRLSKMGPSCPKAFWHSVHTPELAEPLPPAAIIKFSYGHVLEAIAISLSKEAGYKVEGEQDELELLGVKGHRDCVIRGCTVDIKSCSGRVFDKFKTKAIASDDSFGYLDQLDAYTTAAVMAGDPLVIVKDYAYILAIHKELGHMYLYEHKIRSEAIKERIRERIQIAEQTEPPACRCGTIPQGESGNIQLDIPASYSPYRYCCFPRLRTFLYSRGPVYLTEVRRTPDVPEVSRNNMYKSMQLYNSRTKELSSTSTDGLLLH